MNVFIQRMLHDFINFFNKKTHKYLSFVDTEVTTVTFPIRKCNETTDQSMSPREKFNVVQDAEEEIHDIVCEDDVGQLDALKIAAAHTKKNAHIEIEAGSNVMKDECSVDNEASVIASVHVDNDVITLSCTQRGSGDGLGSVSGAGNVVTINSNSKTIVHTAISCTDGNEVSRAKPGSVLRAKQALEATASISSEFPESSSATSNSMGAKGRLRSSRNSGSGAANSSATNPGNISHFDGLFCKWRCALCSAQTGIAFKCAVLSCAVRAHPVCAALEGWALVEVSRSDCNIVQMPPSAIEKCEYDGTVGVAIICRFHSQASASIKVD